MKGVIKLASFQKYKTKSGVRWMFKFYGEVDPRTGKRKQSTRRGFKTKKEAERAARMLENKIQEGTYENDDVTYKYILLEWWETYKNTIKVSTKNNRNSLINNHILPYFGNMKIKDINARYCQRVINEITKNANRSSVHIIKSVINLTFKYAVKKNYISKNPMDHVVIPRQDEEVIQSKEEKRNFWKKDEVQSFLAISKNEMEFQDYVMFHVLIYTGMRKGELLALEWEDINFDNNTIHISKTLYFLDGKEIVQTTKNVSSNRTIHVDDKTIRYLRKLHYKQKEELLKFGITQIPKNIFIRNDLRPIRLSTPNEILNDFIDRHDFHKITVHGLRHTHASLLFEAGADIKDVQTRLGHSNITTTMDTYTHVTETSSIKTAAKFQKYMEKL